MGREDHGCAFGNVVRLLDEDRAALLQCPNDMQVVHDLFADIDRRAVMVESLFDGLDRAVHSRAITARSSKQHPTRALRFGIDGGRLIGVECHTSMVLTAPRAAV